MPLPVLKDNDKRRILAARRLIGGRILRSRASRALLGWTVKGTVRLYGYALAAGRARFIRAAKRERC